MNVCCNKNTPLFIQEMNLIWIKENSVVSNMYLTVAECVILGEVNVCGYTVWSHPAPGCSKSWLTQEEKLFLLVIRRCCGEAVFCGIKRKFLL